MTKTFTCESPFDGPVHTITRCQLAIHQQYLKLKFETSNRLMRDGRLMEIRGQAHKLIESANELINLTSK